VSKPRLVLADDHQIFAEGLRSLLEPEFEVVSVVADGRALLEAAKKHRPDLIVADITMPSLNGIEATVRLREMDIDARVIFLTMHQDIAYARRALDAGAYGYVLKHAAAAELVAALREAMLGRTYVTPMIAGELLHSYRDEKSPDQAHDLTSRQREVLQLLAEGHSAKEIAAILKISTRTAEFHKARIMDVLGVQSTADLVHYAIRKGIISV
jgi:DNA-binding NarL/FixJ family response regulator